MFRFRCVHSVALVALAWGMGLAASADAFASGSTSKTRPIPSARAPAFYYQQHSGAMAFADDLAARRNLDAAWVREQIGQAQHLPNVVRLMTPAPIGTPKNWAAYRARFIEPVRLNAGLRFWQDNRDTLARAESEFGVPASLIVGVIGVETLYGRHTGSFRVIDALSTLAFDFPAAHPRAAVRTEFFREELEQFLSLSDRTGMDAQTLRGSYAGAMGWPQFMPSSWSKYAIDFDGDGRIDLFNSQADVIGSVANYFKAFGWHPGMPTHYPVAFDHTRLDLATLLEPDILPSFTVESLINKGLVLQEQTQQHIGKMALVELENGDAPRSYVLGTENFYTVTRYNWSSYYAMAVIELGEAIETMLGGPLKPGSTAPAR